MVPVAVLVTLPISLNGPAWKAVAVVPEEKIVPLLVKLPTVPLMPTTLALVASSRNVPLFEAVVRVEKLPTKSAPTAPLLEVMVPEFVSASRVPKPGSPPTARPPPI